MNNHSRTAIINATIGQEAESVVAEIRSGRANWRAYTGASRPMFTSETWDRSGIAMLVGAGIRAFEEKAGFRLPWNLAREGSWQGFAWGKNHPRPMGVENPPPPANNAIALALGVKFGAPATAGSPRLSTGADDPVAEAARLAGWLKAAPGFPLLTRLIERETSPRGMGSPRTRVNPARLATRWSPGAAERQLRAVRARADEILSPAGLCVSWAGLGHALENGPRKVGKAALVAACHTLGGDATSYRRARAWMAAHCRHAGSVIREEDGVLSWGPEAPDLVKAGFKVFRQTWAVQKPLRREEGWLVVSPSGETYHSPIAWEPYRWDSRALRGITFSGATALKDALRAFQRRRRLTKEVLPKGVSVLVTRQDSWRAGNCLAGTEEFVRQMGWETRWYIPAERLLETGNSLAANAAKAAALEVKRLMAA